MNYIVYGERSRTSYDKSAVNLEFLSTEEFQQYVWFIDLFDKENPDDTRELFELLQETGNPEYQFKDKNDMLEENFVYDWALFSMYDDDLCYSTDWEDWYEEVEPGLLRKLNRREVLSWEFAGSLK